MGEQEKAGAWMLFMAAAVVANADNEEWKPNEVAEESAEIADAALKEFIARFPKGRAQ